MAGRFVGRDAQLQALRDACLRTAADDVPEAVLVVGDPGSGKSRLLHELRSLRDIGDAIAIAGYEPEQNVSYAAARELLRRLGTGPSRGRDVEAGVAIDWHLTEQLHLFESTHRALVSSATAVITIDDVHWVDEASFSLIHYLVRAAELAREPLAIVAASRPSRRAASLEESLRRLLGSDRARMIELSPLPADAGASLVGELAPHLDLDERAEICTSAAGSPFWLELLATSEERHTNVDREIASRLRTLTADAEEALALLSVVGRPLTADELAGIERWDVDRVDSAIACLDGAGLAASSSQSLTVNHALISGAVARMLGEERTKNLRRRYGVWLEAHSEGDERRLLEALEHQQQGGLPVRRLASRLAGSPRRRLLGVAGLARLADVADDAGPDDAGADPLRRHVAAFAAELGQHELALRRWSDYSVLCGDHPTHAARAAVRASESALQLARPDEAWRQLQRARTLGCDDAVINVEILAQEAAIRLALQRGSDTTRTAASACVAAARSLVGDGGVDALEATARQALLRSLSVALDAARLDADPDRMLVLSEELSAAAAGIDVVVRLRASLDEAMALRFRGQNLDALDRLRWAWDEARRRVLPLATLEIGAVLGLVLVSLGDIDAARTVERECSALGIRLSEFHPSRSFMILLPHVIELVAGDWRRAVEGLDSAAEAEPDPHYRQHARKERALALARLEPERSGDRVRQGVADALADTEAAGCRRCAGETTVRCAEALARVGDADSARSCLAKAEIADADAHNRFWLQQAEGVLLMTTGDPLAEESLAAVVIEAERQSLHLEAVRVRLDLGAMLATARRTAAAELLRHAGTIAERMGASTEQHVAEQLLRSLGVRTWRRGPARSGAGPLSSLTDREVQVAQLIRDGASNPEIAAALFLSRKTIERHVSNLLAKFGARNRAELAVLVTDLSASNPARDEGVHR